MPPIEGVAIGFMISMPGPVRHHDRQEGECGYYNRHELRPQPHRRAVNHGVHIAFTRRFARERLADEDDHDDAGLDDDREQGDVADDDCRGHRIAEQPLQEHASDQRERH